MSDITQRNSKSSATLISNRFADFIANRPQTPNTIRNMNTEKFSSLSVGMLLLGKYVVKKRLDVISGKANVYVCEYNGNEYIAKIYNHDSALSPKIIETLKTLNSPYVAKIYDTGTYNGLLVTIMQYYSLGSLQGKKISLKQLKRIVIPCVNEALYALHNIGVLHKNLKPSNIMFISHVGGVALVDFGISSATGSDASVISAHAAPETLQHTYREESDYYSFGITLYELFCGHTFSENFSVSKFSGNLAGQKLPFPKDMPPNLKNLIIGLTYNDLTHHDDINNPNRRWTYDEVKNWLTGKNQPVIVEDTLKAKMPTNQNLGGMGYKFGDQQYENIRALVLGLASNWSESKKHLKRKLFSGFFSRHDSELTGYCIDAEEKIQNGRNEDVVFWELLYKLAPDTKEFFWKGKIYSSLNDFGQDILEKLRCDDLSEKKLWNEILSNCLLSQYLEIHSQGRRFIDGVKSFEIEDNGKQNNRIKFYILAYFLTGKRELLIDGKIFSSTDELINGINNLLNDSLEKFEAFCYKLIDNRNRLSEEFEAWLIALGKGKELKIWKQNLKTN
ncbi:MAG: protein kinase [Selenomonadaceae bacterium]|nr:protein kinase [Selenomonadaceae bacterium]